MARGSSDATGRVPVLYLAPWVDYGGSDKGTIDWFRWIDRERFAPSLITTQPSPNRRLAEVEPYAEEVWALPELMPGADFPRFIFDFIDSRGVEVLHVMNSRLAFELLPDLASMRRPPKVIVQLHVEEQTKDGYVRYVATRYGNLVDAFSVTSRHLAEAVEGYDVPRGKIEVIYTGVDAETEFAPERIEPIERFGEDRVDILYPGRLTEQKDPQLMVEVAAELRGRTDRFRIQVVGDGNLEQEVRRLVRERGLEGHFRFSPPSREIARWYAASDLLLMTSVFEGVPYVVYESMAMGLPIVAPALPGNVELMGDEGGTLIDPRDDVAAYVDALEPLVRDRALREQVGDASRRRALAEFSLRRMAAEHERLYERLVADAPLREQPAPAPELPPRLAFRDRPVREQPLVSVIVPCFNHGRYLDACLASVERQTYPSLETIVVDDGSTDEQTREMLDAIEAAGRAQVLRQPRNAGPSAARNRAIDAAQGRYLLPLDADNLLVEDAVERLVEQLRDAGEEIGFIYPNLQFFGNRDDYFEPPEYDGHLLLRGNYCDTSSLFDRAIFDAGLRFDESIVLGHEDWDFVLTLAEHGIHGERARARTLLYRKQGFTRSDVVDHAEENFHELMKERHPALYGASEWRHPFVTTKARWAPALSIVALADAAPAAELRGALAVQSCRDVELVGFAADDWPRVDRGPAMRRVPAELTGSIARRLEIGLGEARGPIVVVTAGGGAELLRDGTLAEKLIRRFAADEELDAVVFAVGAGGGHAWRPLDDGEQVIGRPHSIAWRRDERGPERLSCETGDEVGAIARMLLVAGRTCDWRHLDVPPSAVASGGQMTDIALVRPRARRRPAPLERPVAWPAAVPAMSGGVRRWTHTDSWVPTLSLLLCRHHEKGTERRVTTTERISPPGHYLEHVLGAIRTIPFAGTAPLLAVDGGDGYVTTPKGAEQTPPEDAELLGHLELVPFPLFDAVVLARHPETGQQVLLAGADDPLQGAVEPIATVGWIERFPNLPREAARGERSYGLLGLTRSVDLAARRHRYALGACAPGEASGELGAVADMGMAGTEPLWLTDDGYVIADGYRPQLRAPAAKRSVRWTLAPLRWNGPWSLDARARGTARRALTATGGLLRRRDRSVEPPDRPPVGYLFSGPGPARIALYAAIHPLTHDQLLTTQPREATDLGYEDVTKLGYTLAQAPVTGELGPRPERLPWASRFGDLDSAR